jgi:hypothetical protein
MPRVLIPICLAAAIVVAATITKLDAHHAFAAEFDAEKKVTLVGTVVVMEWTNPHAWLTIDVPSEKAAPADRWQLEFGPPNQLFRRGWRKTSLMPGMKITATGFLAKDGRKVANADQITMPDGKMFSAQVGSGGAPSSNPENPQ